MRFALQRAILSRFACGMASRFPTTLAIFLRLNHKTSLALNNTIKLCASAADKEFVNVHKFSTKQPNDVDADQRWMWVDPIKKAVWRNKTTTDAQVRYNYCKVHPLEAAAPIDFCASKSLRTHLEDTTHPDHFLIQTLGSGEGGGFQGW